MSTRSRNYEDKPNIKLAFCIIFSCKNNAVYEDRDRIPHGNKDKALQIITSITEMKWGCLKKFPSQNTGKKKKKKGLCIKIADSGTRILNE